MCALVTGVQTCALPICAVAVDVLLRASPDVRVITTSRQPLGLPSERVLVISPFPVPAPGPDSQLVDATTNDAVTLFVNRAEGAIGRASCRERLCTYV